MWSRPNPAGGATPAALTEGHDAGGPTAVQNGDGSRGGPRYRGSIANPVPTERAASRLHGVDREPFDRDRVGGNVQSESLK